MWVRVFEYVCKGLCVRVYGFVSMCIRVYVYVGKGF